MRVWLGHWGFRNTETVYIFIFYYTTTTLLAPGLIVLQVLYTNNWLRDVFPMVYRNKNVFLVMGGRYNCKFTTCRFFYITCNHRFCLWSISWSWAQQDPPRIFFSKNSRNAHKITFFNCFIPFYTSLMNNYTDHSL